MAHIIDGKSMAAKLREKVTRQVAQLQFQRQITPGLAVVLVGENAASQVYVKNKIIQTTKAGMRSYHHELDAATSETDLLKLVEQLNANPEVHGILIQLPLPSHIDADEVISHIDPDKDVDGFHVINAGRLAVGQEGMVPCTPLGCVLLIQSYLPDLSGAQAVIVGRSNIVGKPLAALLLRENCTVTVAHSRTRSLDQVCRSADVLVAAVGRAEMVKGDWIKPGATVIDVGINRAVSPNHPPRIIGDVEFTAAEKVAGAITPVPGGVGPMTIACLLQNTIWAACRQHRLAVPAG